MSGISGGFLVRRCSQGQRAKEKRVVSISLSPLSVVEKKTKHKRTWDAAASRQTATVATIEKRIPINWLASLLMHL